MSRKKWIAVLVAGVVLFGMVVALSFHLDMQNMLLELLSWLDDIGIWGPAVFTVIYALVVLFVLPGIVFTMGAGLLFGVVTGSICVIAGTMIGATAAFLLARYGFHSRAEAFISKHPKLRVINEYLSDEAFKVVMLTRLIPFFPFKPSNYVFGITVIRYRDFFLGTLIGIVPFTLTNVYAGAVAGDIASLGTRGMDRTPFEWTAYGMGLVLLLAFAVAVGQDARRRLERYRKLDS